MPVIGSDQDYMIFVFDKAVKMSLESVLGILSPVHIFWVIITHRARFVGKDLSGNRYYRACPGPGYKLERRWIVYKGRAEASCVPPEWHGWLHHQSDELPSRGKPSFRRSWQKPHMPDMTGTDKAYRPAVKTLGHRTTRNYEAWKPEVAGKL